MKLAARAPTFFRELFSGHDYLAEGLRAGRLAVIHHNYHVLSTVQSSCIFDSLTDPFRKSSEQKHNHSPVISILPLQWRHNEHDGVSTHQPHDCLLNHLFKGFKKDSKTFIWQRKYMLLDNNPSIFHFMRSKPISYNIHWDKHCGHWTLIGQLHMEGQSMLHSLMHLE